jgi:hypothetical protein
VPVNFPSPVSHVRLRNFGVVSMQVTAAQQ